MTRFRIRFLSIDVYNEFYINLAADEGLVRRNLFRDLLLIYMKNYRDLMCTCENLIYYCCYKISSPEVD